MPTPPSETQIITIYRETVDALYGYVSRRCNGQRALAEDIVQETWLRAVRDWRRAGIPNTPLAWLTTVARNLLINHLRRRESDSIDDVPAELILATIERDAVDDSTEMVATVTAAMARLPQPEAQLLDEFHFQRHRVAHLAEAYGTTERAIEGRLRRARERLKRELITTLPTTEGERQ